MTTINCSACNMQNDCNSAKCENCMNNLLDLWEGGFCKLEPCQSTKLNQMFKEEPEIQIESEVEHEQEPRNSDYGSDKERSKQEALLTTNSKTELSTSDEERSEERSRSASLESDQGSKCKKRRRKNPPCGLLKCPHCDEMFLHSFELKIHQDQHEGKKIQQCDVCQAVLSNKAVLMQHKLRLHKDNVEIPTDKSEFQCNFCQARLYKATKTSAERSREFRARKSLLKHQSKQQQEPNAIVEIAIEDIRNTGPSEDNQVPGRSEIRTTKERTKSAEATRRWRERKKGVSKSQKKQAKTAAERMREYRKRKKLAKQILLKQQSDQGLDCIVSTSSQKNHMAGPSTINSISAELTKRENSQSQQQIQTSERTREYHGGINDIIKFES